MEGEQEIAAIVENEETLHDALRRIDTGEARGAVIVAQDALLAMEHVALVATVIFNPFGPTIETISLGGFVKSQIEGVTMVVRRRLHPFSEQYTQLIAVVSEGGGITPEELQHLVAMFVANNGISPSSKEWATPLLDCVPTGVLMTPRAEELGLTRSLNRAFRWLLSGAEDQLHKANELIAKHGTNFRMSAREQIDDAISMIAGQEYENTLNLSAPLVVPEPSNDSPWEDSTGAAPAFSLWWQSVSDLDYQMALYREIAMAWVGASRFLPGAHQGFGGAIDDFLPWWELFDPTPRMTGSRENLN